MCSAPLRPGGLGTRRCGRRARPRGLLLSLRGRWRRRASSRVDAPTRPAALATSSRRLGRRNLREPGVDDTLFAKLLDVLELLHIDASPPARRALAITDVVREQVRRGGLELSERRVGRPRRAPSSYRSQPSFLSHVLGELAITPRPPRDERIERGQRLPKRPYPSVGLVHVGHDTTPRPIPRGFSESRLRVRRFARARGRRRGRGWRAARRACLARSRGRLPGR